MFKKTKNKKGFTLIEALAVVLIVGVLAAIVVPTYLRTMERVKASQTASTLYYIAGAQKAYNIKNAQYTDEASELGITLRDANGNDVAGSTFASQYFDYNIYGDDKARTTATRTTKEYLLYIDYDTNKVVCVPLKKDNPICKSLGYEEGSLTRKYDTSNIQDWVMEDYLEYAVDILYPLWNNTCGASLTCLAEEVNKLCTNNGTGICLNQINSSSSTSNPTNYVIGADGNKYFWAPHTGDLAFNVNRYGNNPYFFQIIFAKWGGVQMRIGSGSANAGATAKLNELIERYPGSHVIVSSGWHYFRLFDEEGNQLIVSPDN